MIKMRLAYGATLVVVAAAVWSCNRADAVAVSRTAGFVELGVEGSANANVTLAADGDRVAAAWATTGSTGTNIYAALSVDGGRSFARPVRVNNVDGDAKTNGEQPPRIVVKGEAVTVVWVSKTDGVAVIRTAASSNAGATFGPARTITPPGVAGARGWESAWLADEGTLHAAWLDGRNAAPSAAPDAHAAHAGHDASGGHAAHVMKADTRQDIYHAMWRGTEAPIETRVASNVCFCCKTSVVSRGDDVYVAWRHLFPGGVRDIAIAHSADGGRTFPAPVRVSEDNWKIDACPDDGPALAVDGEGVLHVTWPTLVTEANVPRIAIFEAASRDGGATFSPRVRVDGGTAGGAHPRIATDAAGHTAVVWDELAQGKRLVQFRMDGNAPATLSAGGVGSYPAIAAARDGFVVAWTDQSDNRSVIRVRRVL